MKFRFTFFCSLFLLSAWNPLLAQDYWLFFKDKGPEADWHAQHPERLISPQALAKRNQRGIPVDYRDIPVSKTYLARLKAQGIEIHRASKWLNAVSVHTDLSWREIQAELPMVSGMRPVGRFVRHQSEELTVSDPVGDEQEEALAAFDYGIANFQVEMLNVNCLHDQGFAGKDVLVAVFDAGFLNMDTLDAFDSLWTNNRVKGIYDFVDGDTTLFQDNYHGMSVASCFAANQPGVYVGTAPRVSVLLARTETVFEEVHQEEDNWMAAVEWADSLGADIIQSSLGYSTFDFGEGDYTYGDLDGNTTIITRAADIAASKGILVVSSAGNEGNGSWHYITAPCDADSILCVGAVNSQGMKAGFSSVGPTADNRIKPEVAAYGQGTAVIAFYGGTTFQSGTSFSAPLIAGMAACLMEAHPQRSHMDIRQAIMESGNLYPTPDTLLGYGIPDACKADSILAEMDSLATFAELLDHADQHFSFYPNPVTDKIIVEQTDLRLAVERVEVYSAEGMQVLSFNVQDDLGRRWELPTANLSAGMYLLKLHFFGNQSLSHKFVRQ